MIYEFIVTYIVNLIILIVTNYVNPLYAPLISVGVFYVVFFMFNLTADVFPTITFAKYLFDEITIETLLGRWLAQLLAIYLALWTMPLCYVCYDPGTIADAIFAGLITYFVYAVFYLKVSGKKRFLYTVFFIFSLYFTTFSPFRSFLITGNFFSLIVSFLSVFIVVSLVKKGSVGN